MAGSGAPAVTLPATAFVCGDALFNIVSLVASMVTRPVAQVRMRTLKVWDDAVRAVVGLQVSQTLPSHGYRDTLTQLVALREDVAVRMLAFTPQAFVLVLPSGKLLLHATSLSESEAVTHLRMAAKVVCYVLGERELFGSVFFDHMTVEGVVPPVHRDRMVGDVLWMDKAALRLHHIAQVRRTKGGGRAEPAVVTSRRPHRSVSPTAPTAQRHNPPPLRAVRARVQPRAAVHTLRQRV